MCRYRVSRCYACNQYAGKEELLPCKLRDASDRGRCACGEYTTYDGRVIQDGIPGGAIWPFVTVIEAGWCRTIQILHTVQENIVLCQNCKDLCNNSSCECSYAVCISQGRHILGGNVYDLSFESRHNGVDCQNWVLGGPPPYAIPARKLIGGMRNPKGSNVPAFLPQEKWSAKQQSEFRKLFLDVHEEWLYEADSRRRRAMETGQWFPIYPTPPYSPQERQMDCATQDFANSGTSAPQGQVSMKSWATSHSTTAQPGGHQANLTSAQGLNGAGIGTPRSLSRTPLGEQLESNSGTGNTASQGQFAAVPAVAEYPEPTNYAMNSGTAMQAPMVSQRSSDLASGAMSSAHQTMGSTVHAPMVSHFPPALVFSAMSGGYQNAMQAPMATQFSPAPFAGALSGGYQTFGTHNAYQPDTMASPAVAGPSTRILGSMDELFDFDSATNDLGVVGATREAIIGASKNFMLLEDDDIYHVESMAELESHLGPQGNSGDMPIADSVGAVMPREVLGQDMGFGKGKEKEKENA